jgi:two-component system response regulator FixJ
LNRPIVHVVDDDPGVRATVAAVLEGAGLEVQTYALAKELLDAMPLPDEGCLLLDLFLPDMTGIELQHALRARGNRLPMVIITGQGSVPTAVDAMKNGAVDFIEKPFQPETILDVVERALARPGGGEASAAALLERLATLTCRERAIFKAALSGASSKEIAKLLSISPRTVDVHRGNLLKRLGMKSISEAIQLLVASGVPGGTRLISPGQCDERAL